MQIAPHTLEMLLRPLARMALRGGARFQELLTALKRALVSEAQQVLTQVGAAPSTAKLSVMTGLQRPDVQKHTGSDAPPRRTSTIAQIVSTWLYAPAFIDKKGRPRILSYEGRESEFAALVATVSKEISPYAVLFEMGRSGLVEHTPDGLQLVSATHLVTRDTAAGIDLLTRDLSDLLDAVNENLSTELPKNLHVRLEYDNIPPEKIPEVRERIFKLSHQFLHQAQSIIAAHDRDLCAPPDPRKRTDMHGAARARFALTVFSYTAEVTPAEPAAQQKTALKRS